MFACLFLTPDIQIYKPFLICVVVSAIVVRISAGVVLSTLETSNSFEN